MSSLADLKAKLEDRRDTLHSIFAQAGAEMDLSKVSSIQGNDAEKQAQIRALNDEMGVLGQEVDRLSVLQAIGLANETAIAQQMGLKPSAPGTLTNIAGTRIQTATDLLAFLDSNRDLRNYRERKYAGSVEINMPAGINARNLITLGDIAPQPDRGPYVPMGLEMRTISDLFVQGTTMSNMTEYYQQQTLGDTAAETVEGDEAPSDTWTADLIQDPVRDITDSIDTTMDALADNNELQSILSGSLMYSLQHRKDRQLLRGDGAGVNLKGVINRSYIQTQALGADSGPNAIYKGMQLIRGAGGAGFAEPTAIVIHPQNWTAIRLLQTTTGMYLFGAPTDPGTERLWGIPVRQSTSMPLGTALVGAFTPWGTIKQREGVSVMLSTEHSDYFKKRKVAVLAVERLALKIERPSAFCTVTGLTV